MRIENIHYDPQSDMVLVDVSDAWGLDRGTETIGDRMEYDGQGGATIWFKWDDAEHPSPEHLIQEIWWVMGDATPDGEWN